MSRHIRYSTNTRPVPTCSDNSNGGIIPSVTGRRGGVLAPAHLLTFGMARATTALRDTPVLLYDGDCGFCAGSVQFVLTHEPAARRAALRFAPLQGAFGATVRARHPEVAQIDSVLWVEYATDGTSRVRTYSDAGLAALAHCGGVWAGLALLGRLVPRGLRDAVYRLIARHRLSLAAPACLLPSEDARARFLP